MAETDGDSDAISDPHRGGGPRRHLSARHHPVVADAARTITGKDIENGIVTGGDVKNRSLAMKDFRRGEVPWGRMGQPLRPDQSVQPAPPDLLASTGSSTPDGPTTTSSVTPHLSRSSCPSMGRAAPTALINGGVKEKPFHAIVEEGFLQRVLFRCSAESRSDVARVDG